MVSGDGSAGWRSGRLASLGLIIAGCRRRARTRLVAGGTIKLRLAGCSTIWHGIFTILSLFPFALIAGSNLLRRVLTFCWVQPEPLLRLAMPSSFTSGAKALVSV